MAKLNNRATDLIEALLKNTRVLLKLLDKSMLIRITGPFVKNLALKSFIKITGVTVSMTLLKKIEGKRKIGSFLSIILNTMWKMKSLTQ